MDDIVERRRWERRWLEARDEIRRLRAAGDAAFNAMCNQRDNPCDELFQNAIDELGIALSMGKSDD